MTIVKERPKTDDLGKDFPNLDDATRRDLDDALFLIRKEAGGHQKWVCSNPECLHVAIHGPQLRKTFYCRPVPYEPPC